MNGEVLGPKKVHHFVKSRLMGNHRVQTEKDARMHKPIDKNASMAPPLLGLGRQSVSLDQLWPQNVATSFSDPLIRDVDGAAILSCSKATFWRRVADGTIPRPLKIGGMSRWRLSEILSVIEDASEKRDGYDG